MKHFTEARVDALTVAADQAITGGCELVCLLWDLSGRLRVIAKLRDGVDPAAAKVSLESNFTAAAGLFWSELWLWTPDVEKSERRVYEEVVRYSKQVSAGSATTSDIRELDRHLSKQAWFGSPRQPPWQLLPQTPPILSFFSFKGGVGRTTALASFAIQLARAKKRVCVIDLDLEAPGAGTLFVNKANAAHFGVVDYLLECQLTGTGRPPIDDYVSVCDDPAIVGDGPPISIVPAGQVDQHYLEKLARIDFQALLLPSATEDSALTKLLKEVKASRQAEYILIDSRAGLHDIGGLALNGLAHLDVLFGLDSEQSWDGIRLVVSHLGESRVLRNLRQQLCALIFAMAPRQTEKDRKDIIDAFRDTAHDVFLENFYDEEPSGGWPTPLPDNVWKAPAVDDSGEPHFAVPIAFNDDILRATSLAAMAPSLITGDYVEFSSSLLARIGRIAP